MAICISQVLINAKRLWKSTTFISCERYSPSPQSLCSDIPSFAKDTIAEFQNFVADATGAFIPLRPPAGASRPRGYWTIKQKSLLAAATPLLKIRPIIAHNCHPCRAFLRRVSRALSLLVREATQVVRQRRSHHLPVWMMHSGAQEWLGLLSKAPNLTHIIEYDVEDCFLNTPRSLVLPALQFWLSYPFKRRRVVQFFAISKDSKSDDYIGRPCSLHYWEVSAAVVLAVVQWELQNNSLFEVTGSIGETIVLQNKGLPIGGHLSAALVELVALHREFMQPWPALLEATMPMRYRDNFFVALQLPPAFPVDAVADSLSALLSMPVKTVSCDWCMRCLELRLTFTSARPVRCILAFRTDADRQGESGDVQSWPQPDDPRTKMLIGSLLSGLAAKVRFYCHPDVAGFTATLRAMYRFVSARRYPHSWWTYDFAVALLRNGVPIGCLPRPLRRLLNSGTVSQ